MDGSHAHAVAWPAAAQELRALAVIHLQYFSNALGLLVRRQITLSTFWYALRERPMAVAGIKGSYHVDPQDPNET